MFLGARRKIPRGSVLEGDGCCVGGGTKGSSRGCCVAESEGVMGEVKSAVFKALPYWRCYLLLITSSSY